jgi:hypothetical protein
MPIITLEEYAALKAQGLIQLSTNPSDPEKIDIHIDRSQKETISKAAVLDWTNQQIATRQAEILELDTIKQDITNIP